MNKKDKAWIKLMEAGEGLGCHQMPERSFFYKGYQFPVCARCTGVLISSAAALFSFCFIKKKMSIKLCVGMSGVMLADWLVQYWGIQESNNRRRLVTGFIGGFGYVTLHLHLYRYIWKALKGFIKQKN